MVEKIFTKTLKIAWDMMKSEKVFWVISRSFALPTNFKSIALLYMQSLSCKHLHFQCQSLGYSITNPYTPCRWSTKNSSPGKRCKLKGQWTLPLEAVTQELKQCAYGVWLFNMNTQWVNPSRSLAFVFLHH